MRQEAEGVYEYLAVEGVRDRGIVVADSPADLGPHGTSLLGSARLDLESNCRA